MGIDVTGTNLNEEDYVKAYGYHYDVAETTFNEEWYQHYFECKFCQCSFMVDNKPHYCPYCGHKIKTIKHGNEYITEA